MNKVNLYSYSWNVRVQCATTDYCTISTVAGSRVTRGPSDDANWALVTGHGDGMLLDFGSRPVT